MISFTSKCLKFYEKMKVKYSCLTAFLNYWSFSNGFL